MKYITATIDAGGKLVCNLDYYTDSEGKTQFFPLLQSSVNYYAFRLITNNLPDEWRDILQAQNNRWVIFQNTHLEDGKNTTAMPLTLVNDRGMVYLQAVIPSYILAKPGVLSITILFALGETIKQLSTVSQNESDFEPLRILPSNDTIDKAILSGITIEDKTIYHQLIGTLLGGSDGQVLQKNSASGTMGYTWVDGSKLSPGIIFGGYVTPYTSEKTKKVYALAEITPSARTAIFGEGSTETKLILLNQATASDTIDGIIPRGWAQCTNMQFLARESVNSSDGLNVSLNDYLVSDGEKWNIVPAVDKTVIERIVADSYVPWNYGSNAGDTEKTVNMVNISGNAGSANKVNHSLTIGSINSKTYDGSSDVLLENIDGNWLTGKTVDKTKLADDVSEVYIPWNYSGGSQEAVNINITGNAKSADKVNNALSIAGKTYDGSMAIEVEASDLKTALKNQIGSEQIIDDSVTTVKIPNKAITEDKLADGAVITRTLAKNAVTYDKLDGEGMKSRLLRIGTGNRAPEASDASSFDLWVQWF